MPDSIGLVVTGTRGAGKTSVAQALADSRRVTSVPAVTTRESRADDRPGAYTYLSEHQFAELLQQGWLLIDSAYGGFRYGITMEAVTTAVSQGQIPVVTVTPESARRLVLAATPVRWRAVFLDAPDTILDQRLAEDGRAATDSDRSQRAIDRSHDGPPLIHQDNTGTIDVCIERILAVLS